MIPDFGHEPLDVDLYVTNTNPWTEEDFKALRHLRMKVGDVVPKEYKSNLGIIAKCNAIVSKVFFWGYETIHREFKFTKKGG